MEGVSRRRLLVGGLALAGSGALATMPVLRHLATSAADSQEAGSAEWVATSCLNCPAWCPQLVRVSEGRATGVKGNPESLMTEGAMCARGHLGLQQLYDPDRIKGPMKRTNPEKGKGIDPGFVPISWEEALENLASRIVELRQRREIHRLAFFRGRYTQANTVIFSVLPRILGTPNTISHSSICAETDKWGSWAANGYWNYNAYDLENANYVLIFGVDPMAAHRPVSRQQLAWGRMRRERGVRGKVVVVDPRLSITGAKADEWVPIVPGTDVALVLALCHSLLVQGLWDREFIGDFGSEQQFRPGQSISPDSFVETHATGLIQWWNLELRHRTPEWAEDICGVPADTIRRLAREAGTLKPAFAWRGRGANAHPKGCYTSYAIMALNGLLGAVDTQGGLLEGPPVPRGPAPNVESYLDDVAREGLSREIIDQRGRPDMPAISGGRVGGGVVTNRVADAILEEDPYPLEIIIGYHCNFNFSAPETGRWNRALSQVPYFVHITPMVSEMTEMADLVLPTPHYLEKWSYDQMKGGRYAHVAIKQPVVSRLWDTRSSELELPYLLAQVLKVKGFPAVKDSLDDWARDPETGKRPRDEKEFARIWVRMMTQPVWPNGSWEEFCDKGVWNSQPYEYRSAWDKFNTPSGRFEFVSGNIDRALKEAESRFNRDRDDILEQAQYDARGTLALVPHFEEPRYSGDGGAYPLHMITYKPHLNAEGRSMNSTWAQEVYLPHLGVAWENVAEINPETARQAGIESGQKIRISSPAGSIVMTAVLVEGVHPKVVAIAFGQGHHAYGRWARGRGANPNDIMVADYDRLSGQSSFNSTRVSIEPVPERGE